MKFTLDQKDLLAPLKHVYGVAERRDRTRAPILAHTLIRARRGAEGEDGTIAFDACDDEVLYESEELAGTVEEEGDATVEAHLLHDLVNRFPRNTAIRVRITPTAEAGAGDAAVEESTGAVTELPDSMGGEPEKRVIIEAGGSTFALPSLAPDDFQRFADPPGEAPLQLPAAELRRLIDSCRVSMSDDDARLHLNGIFLHTADEDGKTLLRAAATDGHRLACSAHVLTAGGGAIKDGITLPKKAVEQVDGLLRNADGDVALWSGDNLLRLNVGSVSMTARLNQGGFPDYRRVIPEALENRLRVNRQALLQAIDRLSAVTDPKSRGITFQISGDTLVLSAGSPATGLGREEVGAKYAGKALAIGFNSDYVTACCRVIPDQELVLEFDSPKHAAVIRGATSDETVHVVMPLNVAAQSHAALLEEVGAGSDVGMRFTQGRNTLLAPLAHMHGVVERVGTRPILSHVLIRAEAGSVVFDAGDNQVLYESERLTAEVDVAGAATVEAPLFYSVVGKLAEGDDVRVSLAPGGGADADVDGAWLVVEAGPSKFILPSLSTDDFPTLHDLEWERGFELPVSDLRGLLNWCRISMSNDPARMHLNGVFLHAVEDGGQRLLRAGATDGHRLSQAECQCPEGAEALVDGVTLPRKAVEQVERLLADADGAVRVGMGNGWMRLEVADVVVVTRLHESKFPDYQRVIPTVCNSTLRVNCAILQRALERLTLVADRKSRAIRFELSEESLAASAGDHQHGVGREVFEGTFRGKPVVIGFRSEYLMEFCQTARGDEMIMEFQASGQPAVIRDTGEVGRLHVIMPIRV